MYCSYEDILRFLSPEDLRAIYDTQDDSEVQSKVEEAIKDASGEMDSYLGVRYEVPLSEVPRVVKNYCIYIALHTIFRTAAAPRRTKMSEEIEEGYKRAIEWLKDVAAGRAKLVGVNERGEAVDGGSDSEVDYLAPRRLFSHGRD